MPIVYSKADQSIRDLMNRVMSEHFSVLWGLEPGLDIDIKMGRDPKTLIGCKCHGHPCVAKIKVVKAEERATWNRSDDQPSFPDLRLFIDHYRWEDFSERERQAVLFHELNHIVPVRDKKSGQLKFDEYGRIKIKLRCDDWILTGFAATIEVFGEDAIEYQALASIRKKLSQMGLKFGKESRPKKSESASPSLLAESVAEDVA